MDSLEKELLYQIEEKKASLILEKKPEEIKNSIEKSSFSSIFQILFGLSNTTLLFPYSQGWKRFMLKNSNEK